MSELRRTMRLPDATAMVVGIIIGASIFVQPSEITRLVPDAGGIAPVWALAGVLTLVGALICAELSDYAAAAELAVAPVRRDVQGSHHV